MRQRLLMRLTVLALALIYVYSEYAVATVQTTRHEMIQAEGAKVYYTKRFDLSGLPLYKPEQKVTGNIRQWGNNYIVNLVKVWEEGFNKYHPDVKFEDHLKTSEAAIPGLYTHVA